MLKVLKNIFLTFLYIILCSSAISANVGLDTPFTVLNNRVGLPSDTILDMCRDKNGFLWIATDEGLCRYDGYEFKLYSPLIVDGIAIKSGQLKSILCDSDGYIWLGMIEGVYRFNPVTERVVAVDNDRLKLANITDLAEDHDGRIWVATQKHLFTLDKSGGDVVEMRYVDHYSKRQSISGLFCDSNGDMWIGFWGNGFMRYKSDEEVFQIYLDPVKLRESISTIYEDVDGSIYMGVWSSGIVRIYTDKSASQGFRIERLKFPKRDVSLDKSIVSFIMRDKVSGNYWLGTPKGIFVLDKLSNPSFLRVIKSGSNYNQLSNSEISCAISDENESILWFGTYGGGVNRLDLKPQFIGRFSLEPVKDVFGTTTVRTIYDDGKYQWLGIKGNGMMLRKVSNGEIRQAYSFLPLRGINSGANTVNVIYPLKSRPEIWLATRYAGLASVELNKDGEPCRVKHFEARKNGDLRSRNITALYEDNRGRVWVGSNYGLYCGEYRDGDWSFTLISRNGVLPNSRITSIIGDDNGRIWLAVKYVGIFSFVGTDSVNKISIDRHPVNRGNKTLNSFETLYLDTQSRVWAGTSGLGLLLCSEESGEFNPVDDPLLDDISTVNSIIEGDDDDLWIATNGGLYLCSNYGEEEMAVHHYTYDDGLVGNTFVSNAVHKNKAGDLYFGSYNGFSIVKPRNSYVNNYEPEVVLTDISLRGESIMYPNVEGEKYLGRNDQGEVISLNLPFESNSFSLEFTSLSFSNPAKNRYIYKLEGFDDDWREVDSHYRSVAYSNLNWGRYKLMIRGTNDSNVLSRNELVVYVNIAPPIYATWWAYLIYFIFFFVVSYVVYVNVAERIKLRNRLVIESHKQAQLEELNESKLRFFTNISHEFLTPLSIISCGIDDMAMKAPQDSESYHIMRNNVSRLMRMLEQILEFRKAESANLKLKVGYGDISMWVDRLANENFTPLIKQRRYDFTVELPAEPIYGWFDRDKLDKMLYNLISNAIKYNVEGGFVRVKLESVVQSSSSTSDSDISAIRLSVHNSGGVIAPEQKKSLFKPFYDGEFRRYGTRGNGIGLSLTHSLVKLHNGEITVESSVENGTCFTIVLPIAERVFAEDQIDRSELIDSKNSGERDSIGDANHEGGVVGVDLDDAEDADVSIPTLLYVEDDDELSQMMVSWLNRDYNVVQARNGKEGVERAIALNPDIIVSDVMMPDIDGFEMCRILKSEIATSHIPIILLSAKITADDKVEGLSLGAQAYLTKPIQPKVLVAQIESLLSNQAKAKGVFKQNHITIPQMDYSSVDEEFLKRAVAVVNDNLDNSEFEIKDFLVAMSMTNSMLYRKLKSLTGLSPNEFVRSVRIKAAHALITEKYNVITISEVAYAVGFNIPKYFTARFKREYGCTPSQYKERLMEQHQPSGLD